MVFSLRTEINQCVKHTSEGNEKAAAALRVQTAEEGDGDGRGRLGHALTIRG